MYEELLELEDEKKTNPTEEWAKDLDNSQRRKTQMALLHLKGCSTSLRRETNYIHNEIPSHPCQTGINPKLVAHSC